MEVFLDSVNFLYVAVAARVVTFGAEPHTLLSRLRLEKAEIETVSALRTLTGRSPNLSHRVVPSGKVRHQSLFERLLNWALSRQLHSKLKKILASETVIVYISHNSHDFFLESAVFDVALNCAPHFLQFRDIVVIVHHKVYKGVAYLLVVGH